MSLLESKAFDNFVKERSEEVLQKSTEYQEVHRRVLEKEKEITKKIQAGQFVTFEDFNDFECEIISLISCTKKILYKSFYEVTIKPTA